MIQHFIIGVLSAQCQINLSFSLTNDELNIMIDGQKLLIDQQDSFDPNLDFYFRLTSGNSSLLQMLISSS